jgi:hypothetical protein
MNNEEAMLVLDAVMQEFKREAYRDLVAKIGQGPVTMVRQGADAKEYQLEFEFLWDGTAGSRVMVIGSIDDGGWGAFFPLSRSFIKTPDESFVGE